MSDAGRRKTCPRCERSFQLEVGFYRDKTKGDGYSTHCRTCRSAKDMRWRRKNPQYAKEWRQNNREYMRESNRKWQAKDESQIKKLAHRITKKAIRSKVLVPKDCESCKAPALHASGRRRVHAHHDDYRQPLLVRWLCPSCHQAFHGKEKRKAIGFPEPHVEKSPTTKETK